MIGTILINGLLGFGMIIALLFCMGDATELLSAPVSLAGYPFIQIYYNATQSLAATNAMVCVPLVIVIMAHFSLMAGCSRTAWAFARDKGLPLSNFFSHVGSRSQVPFRAIMLSVVIQVLLGLINIGSYYAFAAFVNAAAVTLYITYVSDRFIAGPYSPPMYADLHGQIVPVILGLLKRWRGETIPYGPFQLGKWRTAVNIVAIIYTIFTSFFLLWPTSQHTNAVYMNWSIVIVGGVVIISIVWWFIEGRKNFVGPDVERTLERRVD